MRNLMICFTLFALCFAVLMSAHFLPEGSSAVAVEQIGVDAEVALGPFPFPDTKCQVCCEQKRETRKCVRWCCVGVQEDTLPATMSIQALMSKPGRSDNVGYTDGLRVCSIPETTRLNL